MAKLKVNIGHLKRDNIKTKVKKNTEKAKKEEVKETSEITVTTSAGNNLLPPDIKFDNIFTENKELNDFLNKKSTELTKIQASARLHLGKIFQDVFDELSGKNQHDGLYVKWLKFNGYNKMTALRHRNRLELYEQMKRDEAKSIIATAPQKLIDMTLKHEKKVEIIDNLNTFMTREQLSNFLEDEENKKLNLEPLHDFNLEENFKKFTEVYSHLDIKTLPQKKQEKLEKLIEQFLKIAEE